MLQYSTYEGTTSKALDYDDDQEKQKLEGGGLFVKTLQETFKEMYKEYDLEEMLREVGRKVQSIETGDDKQCPEPVLQLRYKLFFKID